jgi:hypothetical protein
MDRQEKCLITQSYISNVWFKKETYMYLPSSSFFTFIKKESNKQIKCLFFTWEYFWEIRFLVILLAVSIVRLLCVVMKCLLILCCLCYFDLPFIVWVRIGWTGWRGWLVSVARWKMLFRIKCSKIKMVDKLLLFIFVF